MVINDENFKETKVLLESKNPDIEILSISYKQLKYKKVKMINIKHLTCMRESSIYASKVKDNYIRCPKCKYNTKDSEVFKDEFNATSNNEYELLSEYKRYSEKVKVKHILCGHEYFVTPNKWLAGRRCPKCFGPKKFSYNDFYEKFKNTANDEYELLTTSYKNVFEKVKVKHILCGHEYFVTPNKWLAGRRCPKCAIKNNANKYRKSNDEFINNFNKSSDSSDYILLSNYINSKTKIKIQHTTCNSIYEVTPEKWLAGRRCPYCSKNKKKTTESFIKEYETLQHGTEYTLLEGYINNHTNIKFMHTTCNTIFEQSPNRFLNGRMCPKCTYKISRGEDLIRSYLDDNKIIYKEQYKIDECKDKRPLPFDFAIFNKTR